MPSLPTGTVTFLFTDIEGSTKLWEQHPNTMRHALARHDALLRQSIEAHGGYIFKTVGDAFCAAFGASGSRFVRHICRWRTRYDHSVASVRAALSEEVFQAAWTQGREMTMEQAMNTH